MHIYNPSTQGAEEGAHDLESSLDYIMNTRLASAIETLPQKTKKYSVQKRRKGGGGDWGQWSVSGSRLGLGTGERSGYR